MSLNVLSPEEWKQRLRDSFLLFEHKMGTNAVAEKCAPRPAQSTPPNRPRPTDPSPGVSRETCGGPGRSRGIGHHPGRG